MRLDLGEIDNLPSRTNFELLQAEFDGNPILRGEWKLVVVGPFQAAGTFKVYHKLGFKPSDIIPTKQSGTITFNFSSVNEDSIDVVVTAGAEGRFLIGRIR